jgi:hypothetical protein
VEAADAAVLCTSMDCPAMDATVPNAPGGAAGRPEAAELEVVELPVLAADDPPQAARASAAPPRTASTDSRWSLGDRAPEEVGPEGGNRLGWFMVDAP